MLNPRAAISRSTEVIRAELSGVRVPLSRSVPNRGIKLKVLKFRKSVPGLVLDTMLGPEAQAETNNSKTVIHISFFIMCPFYLV
jgi:hypothetical protein